MKKVPFILLLILTTIFTTNAAAQSVQLPEWVAMIDNPTTNYYDAMNSFESYWKGKIKPIEEMDLKEMNDMSTDEKLARKNYFASMTIEDKNYFDLLQYHYKRFKQWKKDVKPFVQEDGRILTMNERIAIWDKQQAELKQQKK